MQFSDRIACLQWAQEKKFFFIWKLVWDSWNKESLGSLFGVDIISEK